MTGDVNFDGIATAFENEIYGSSKGRVRLAVLWTDLLESVPELSDGSHRILDAGGGSGHIALRLARLGNEVVLCEPSREMLDRAQTAIDDAGLGEKISTFHGGIQELDQLAACESFDVIACHAVLEWLADPRDAVERLARWLKPAGYLSLMFYNRNAALMKRALRGEFAEALQEHEAGPACRGWGDGATPLSDETVAGWLSELHLRVQSKAGIRIFHDHLSHDALTPDRVDELLEIEKALRQVEPFASLGQHIHLVAQSSP